MKSPGSSLSNCPLMTQTIIAEMMKSVPEFLMGPVGFARRILPMS